MDSIIVLFCYDFGMENFFCKSCNDIGSIKSLIWKMPAECRRNLEGKAKQILLFIEAIRDALESCGCSPALAQEILDLMCCEQ